MRKIGLICLLTLATTALAVAQMSFKELAKPDSVTRAQVVVHQSAAIAEMLNKDYSTVGSGETMKGFRVQIFSGNRGQISRDRAFKIEKEILAKFPRTEVYVTYTAPFWKVRVGNCRNNDEAQKLRSFMTTEFPSYKDETYIVPDKITIK